MRRFAGVVAYEFCMGARRKGVWLALVLGALPLLTSLHLNPSWTDWHNVGWLAYQFNFVMPMIGGVAIADRLWRDQRLGLTDLLWSTPLSSAAYVLGKYAGALLAVLTPVLAIWTVVLLGVLVAGGPLVDLGIGALAFLAVIVPAYAFVGAFSLACPAILPLRLYQVLFICYYLWGNFVSPKRVPTLSVTILQPAGEYTSGGLFRGQYTVVEGAASLAVLLACAGVALLVLERYLSWQAARA